ncbi:hydrogenase nickel incorporation protein HypB [Lysinibacillus sphaericus]|uniref:Hydrogenase accessory protein HypB n=2 Tax=Lysinibacillus TaxID=400634 RepID=A0A2S0K6V4_LYSSH|nr:MULTISPECIES: hydrogenase nickel incorporation protein HypB [Lysinibacillus]AVK99102.1 hydrogenase accessory protein HypB [Lysinibacillus sphaericus]MCS1382460.1 hydrogenase nickel incorporation protein HypB [Lysinibacillus sphaericus]MED4545955.1 hydrogenase nickel incorporation protein HypB [Lysinibacillus sphaericus]TKI20219.1 hydrogenase nickel incorporation protein HypB [Lysinibacillus sphaericus]TKI47902.1 hydrogenase nickel incorporation protein HypB [Lysinibacillus tabacifolii]
MKIKLKEEVLTDLNAAATFNRNLFKENKTLVINLMSSPGAGKTTLLEETVKRLADKFNIAVIEGDLATERDAERLRSLGIKTVQINTVGGCHLDARMIAKTIPEFNFESIDILFIENIGNLVCPSGYDLGQDYKVVVLSVPEGNDKIPKYPVMFRRTDLTIINKIDLLPYVAFNIEEAKQDLAQINPTAQFKLVSATTGEGIDDWINWIKDVYRTCIKH